MHVHQHRPRAWPCLSSPAVAVLTGTPTGAGVVNVVAGGAAAKAGLQSGDVITGVAGTQVRSAQELASALANLSVGQPVAVVVQRGGGSRTLQVILGRLR